MEYVFVIGAIVGTGFTVAAQYEGAKATVEAELLRQRQLENEKTNAELQALDEENERLIALTYTNSVLMTAMSGDATEVYGPSVLGIRKANLRAAAQDLGNVRLNLASTRAALRNQIMMSRKKANRTWRAGMLNIGSTLVKGGMMAYSLMPGPGSAAGSTGWGGLDPTKTTYGKVSDPTRSTY